MTTALRGFVSARPGPAAAVLLLVAALVAGTPAAAGAAGSPARLDNPYAGAKVYVNPEWSARAAAEPGGGLVAGRPTAVWLDRTAAIEGSDGAMGLREHLDAAVAQGADLVQLVLHNLPGRDCDRRVPPGELTIRELSRYRTEYVDPIAGILASPAYADLRIVTIVEPDALPNLVTHTSPRDRATPLCDEAKATGAYVLGVGYALARLGAIANVYPYLDISHHGRLGWPDNAAPAADVFVQAANSSGSTVGNVHGFVANTANYSVLREEYFTVDDVVNGQSVRAAARWVDWNHFVDEVPYAQRFRERLIDVGFPPGIGMLIDTSRNGWGGPGRPTGPGPRTTPNEYVEASRIDRRAEIGNWCNQAGSGLGERPTAAPAPGIDAYLWVKPPGESDGASNPLDTNHPYEPMCDPAYSPPRGQSYFTGALPGAPPAGRWFPAHFQELLRNAWPAL